MNSFVKNSLISLCLSAIATIATGFVNTSSLVIPSTGTEIIAFVILFIAVLAGTMLSSRTSTSSSVTSTVVNSAAETGTVKWFNIKKGYGFITRDQGDDVFVHYRNIQGKGRRTIAEGQRVQFVVIDGDKGLQADEVETI